MIGMSWFRNTNIGTRLLAAFLLCSFITVFAIAAGSWALNGLRKTAEKAAGKITTVTRAQGLQAAHMAELRSIISAVTEATQKDQLTAAEERLSRLTKEWTDAKAKRAFELVSTSLIPSKQRELNAAAAAHDLQAKMQERLAQLSGLTAGIVDSLAFEMEMEVQSTGDDSKSALATGDKAVGEKMGELSKATSNAMETIKTAYVVGGLASRLNSQLKDALLADSADKIRYVRSDTQGAIQQIEAAMKQLPEGDETKQIVDVFGKLKSELSTVLDLKAKLIESPGDKALAESLATAATSADAKFTALSNGSRAVADSTSFEVEFTMTSVVDDTSAAVKNANKAVAAGMDKASKTTTAALNTIKAAMQVQTHGQTLRVQTLRIMVAENLDTVKYATTDFGVALNAAKQALKALPQDDDTATLGDGLSTTAENLTILASHKSTAIEARNAIAALLGLGEQAQTPDKDADGKQNGATIPECLAALDAASQASSQALQDETTAAASQSTRAASHWQKVLAMVGIAAFIGALLVGWAVARSIVKPLVTMQTAAEEFRKGDFLYQLNYKAGDEVGKVATAMRNIARAQQSRTSLATAIAAGDLTVSVEMESDKDLLGRALEQMVEGLAEVVGRVREAALQINSGSSQVSDASQALSQGATEQAASLQEITSSMTELGGQTRANAENATQANQLATAARDSAERGAQRMRELTGAMGEIDASSQQISKIIKTIDDIAFQTNLLALNAAVEAARAGRHGKGFAVVAEEVRSLASRSAKAAKETADLIETSGKTVDNGKGIANATAEALEEIVTGVTKTTDLIGEIAAASNEQAQGIAQVNQGLQQIDSVTQQNTANAEETASAAQELSSQADLLQKLLSHFALDTDSRSLPAATAPESRPSPSPLPAPAPVRSLPPAADDGWGATPAKQPSQPPRQTDDLITWSNDLSVLVPKFDGQHQNLVKLINRLYAALRSGKANDVLEEIIAELTEYTQTHFADEEAMMRVHKYPDLDRHIEEHEAFVAKVVDVTQRFKDGMPLGVEVMNFLKGWLINHIQKVDRHYGEFFHEKGLV